jgi:uncharacterized protein
MNTKNKSIEKTTVNCPTCKTPVIWSNESSHRPFCSQRCQQIDFGEWATESFSIPGTPSIVDPSGLDIDENDMTRH